VFVIIVGCGRVGSELAYSFSQKGHEVTVIDHMGASFQHLHAGYRGRALEAEVLGEDVLRSAGIEHANGLAAVTNSDVINAVVGHLARSVFHVPIVVARNYDPRFLPLHEAFGLTVVSSTAWGAQRIEDLLQGPGLRPVLAAGHGEVEVYELAVGPAWVGRRLSELLGGLECRAVLLTHSGRAGLPEAETVLAEGDVLHVAATRDAAAVLRGRLRGKEA
jgi:trk system potassium uptake protein TrkA